MNEWVIEILKGEKIKFGQIFEFFHNLPILIFKYLSIFNLKIVQHWKKHQIPKIASYPSSHQNVLLIFIFNFENCSSLFQILIIYALN